MPAARPFRVHERRSVRLGVSVEHVALGWRRDAQVLDVGLGGACVELPLSQPGAVDVDAGDRLTLGFVAPTLWDPLPVRARVAWVRARPLPPPPLSPASARPSAGAGRMLAAAIASASQEPLRFGVAFEHDAPAAVYALFELVGQLAYE